MANAQMRKLPLPMPQSILDRDDLMRDEDDEIFILASQNAEEEERRLNQERVQKANEMSMRLDLSYSAFHKPVASTSTQRFPGAPISTGYANQRRDVAVVDLTIDSQSMAPPKNKPVQTSTNSSQKENFSASQTLTRQSNQIRALQIQLKNHMTKNADLQEKLMSKDGETSNLRKDKKNLEEEIRQLRLQKFKDAAVSKDNPEINRLNRELQRLREEKNFQDFNQSLIRVGPVENIEIPTQQLRFCTNISKLSSMQLIEASKHMFEDNESLPNNIESQMQMKVNKVQKRLAQVHLCLMSGETLDDEMISTIFLEASQMILQIKNYVSFLEAGIEKKIVFQNDPALSVFLELSAVCFRNKLTTFDYVANTLDSQKGFLSIYQPQKLFPEEIADKPRRIIAFYASIARFSKKFSQRLLLEENEYQKTFAMLMKDLLVDLISESDKVFDYFGLAMATASLVASLAVHYDHYEPNQTIDVTLIELFRATLACRCDNPFVMHHLSEFLFHITKNPQKTQIASQLCVNFKGNIDFSKIYSYFCYPEEACSFQLFLMYLLTAFKMEEDLNELEFGLLLQTTHNLNRITSNIQEMSFGTLQFLEKGEQSIDCKCLSSLVNAIIHLNHLALSHRNMHVSYSMYTYTSGSPSVERPKDFNKRK